MYVLEDPNDNNSECYKGLIVSVFLDRKKDCWVAVQGLLDHKGAVAMNITLPLDFNEKLELIIMPEVTANTLVGPLPVTPTTTAPATTTVTPTTSPYDSHTASIRVIPVSAVRGCFSLKAGQVPVPSTSPLRRRSTVTTVKKEISYYLRNIAMPITLTN